MGSRSTLDRLYGGNQALYVAHDSEVMLDGPAGTGKSVACCAKLHRCAIKYPGMRALIARKTRESLTQSVLVTFEERVLDPAWRLKIASNQQRRVRQSYRYPNGSEIVVGGLDKPSKVMSTEYDLIYVNEAVETLEHDWESLSSRLRNGVMPYQQIMGDTNPDAPTHWIKQREASGKLRLIQSRHEDNPSVTLDYIARLDALTGVRYLRLRKGIWAGAEGMVYDEWDAAVHVIDPFPIPAEWRRVRSIDFGFTNPFVCQWWAVDGDGRMHLYRELYQTRRIVSDWATEIHRLSAGESCETVSDHDAEDRATLAAAGISTLPARKQVKPGIEAVQQRLRKAGDGRPRLYIHRNCRVGAADAGLLEQRKPTCTLEEFDGYTWAKATDGRAAKEEPVKLNDHGMDALRYAVAHVDRLGTYSAGAW